MKDLDTPLVFKWKSRDVSDHDHGDKRMYNLGKIWKGKGAQGHKKVWMRLNFFSLFESVIICLCGLVYD